MQDIDERTNLAANSMFELLLFRLGEATNSERRELFGINVFKVREILVMPEVTAMVNMPPTVMGVANIRGQMITVINLPAVVGCKPTKGLGILLVTEFARTTQAFAVEEVNEIVRLEWKHVLSAEGSGGGLVTSIARLDGNAENTRLAQVLDVEQILRDVLPEEEKTKGVAPYRQDQPAAGHHDFGGRRFGSGSHDDRTRPASHGRTLHHDQDGSGSLGPVASDSSQGSCRR